jgi:TolB-like protein/CheY-like chemotaxis protein
MRDPGSYVLQVQKMEALGRLTGGVAHDFNNLLTVVLGNATALRLAAQTEGNLRAAKRAEMIERAAERGGRLAAQLLAFSRNQLLQPDRIPVLRLLEEMRELLVRAAGETIQVRIQAPDDLWHCFADPGQLESALLNLVLNSRDAMPLGGTVTISSRNEDVGPARAAAAASTPGGYVRIEVADTGCGIPAELTERVFEPFFTTKPIGKGSGLGLAQVHGFAGQSGGWVELVSEPGRGTTVSLLLPRAQMSPERQTVEASPAPPPRGGGQTVLVVEADPDLRATTRERLEESGYRVTLAPDASTARRFLVSGEPVDVLLTDTVLPGGVSGIDLVRDARRIRPGINVLLTSSVEAPLGNQVSDPEFELLSKPYQPGDLLRVLGAMLRRPLVPFETESLIAAVRDAPALALASAPQVGGPALNDEVRQRAARPGRNGIRLGVMPFKTLAGSPEHEAALGLAEEMTAAFSRFRWISCIGTMSVAAAAGEPRGSSPVWRQLDLDYLLDGTLRREQDQIRVVVRLLNMRSAGEVTWTRRFDDNLANVLNLQDQIAAETVAQVAPEVLLWEGQAAEARGQVHPTSYDLMLRAIPAIYRLDLAGFRRAGECLNEALRVDPGNAALHSWRAQWYLLMVGQGWAEDITQAVQRADELAERAVMLDPSDARGLTIAGHVRAFLHRQAKEALFLHERAIAINPNLTLAWCYSGLAHSYLGEHAEAVRRIRYAQRLSPHDPHNFFFEMSLIIPFLLTGGYEVAASIGRRAREQHPGLSSTYKGLVAALGHLGLHDEAARELGRLSALEPGFNVREAVQRSPLLRQQDLEIYAKGLRLAGVPEGD